MAEGQLYKMQLMPKKKIPVWVLILVGVVFLALAAIIAGIVPGINFRKTPEGKSAIEINWPKISSPSSSRKITKSQCQIYTRKGVSDKTKRGPTKEGDNTVELKFKEGSEVRLKDGEFISLCGENLSRINKLLKDYSNLSTQRLFSLPEEDLAAEYEEARQKDPDVADLNLYYRLTFPAGTPMASVDNLINKLNEFDVVEIAYPVPPPAPPP